MSTRTRLVDLELDFRHETDAAYGVWNGEKDGSGREVWVWLPKKAVERDGDTFTMPERLAIEKGLV